MKSPRKRNKAYKPKKVQSSMLALDKALMNKAIDRYKEATAIYEFEMTLHLESVVDMANEYKQKHNIAIVPREGWLEIYDQTDTAIAIVMDQVNFLNWEIAVDTSLYNFQTEEVTNVPFYVELPSMTHEEIMSGTTVSVKREDGFKTRWKGLQKEVSDCLNQSLPAGFTVVRTMYEVKFQARFKNKTLFDEFNMLRNLRDQDLLLPFVELAEESLKSNMSYEEMLSRMHKLKINKKTLNRAA